MDKTEAHEFCSTHCEHIPEFMNTFMRAWSKLFISAPINPPQAGLLMYINRQQPCKMSELAAELDLSPGAITQMVDPLVTQGLLERISDDKDRRVVLVRLTANARDVISMIQRRKHLMQIEIFSSLSKEEALLLVSLLEKLEQSLSNVDITEVIQRAELNNEAPVPEEDMYSVD